MAGLDGNIGRAADTPRKRSKEGRFSRAIDQVCDSLRGITGVDAGRVVVASLLLAACATSPNKKDDSGKTSPTPTSEATPIPKHSIPDQGDQNWFSDPAKTPDTGNVEELEGDVPPPRVNVSPDGKTINVDFYVGERMVTIYVTIFRADRDPEARLEEISLPDRTDAIVEAIPLDNPLKPGDVIEAETEDQTSGESSYIRLTIQ